MVLCWLLTYGKTLKVSEEKTMQSLIFKENKDFTCTQRCTTRTTISEALLVTGGCCVYLALTLLLCGPLLESHWVDEQIES